jgi:hypothetical protein
VPYDHPDFNRNAFSEDLFRASFTKPLGRLPC